MRVLGLLIATILLTGWVLLNSSFHPPQETTAPAEHICGERYELPVQVSCTGPDCNEQQLALMRQHMFHWLDDYTGHPERLNNRWMKAWQSDFELYLTSLSELERQQYGFYQPSK